MCPQKLSEKLSKKMSLESVQNGLKSAQIGPKIASVTDNVVITAFEELLIRAVLYPHRFVATYLNQIKLSPKIGPKINPKFVVAIDNVVVQKSTQIAAYGTERCHVLFL